MNDFKSADYADCADFFSPSASSAKSADKTLPQRFGWRGVALSDSIAQIYETLGHSHHLLYALALLLLTVPVILIAFGNWGVHNDNQTFKDMVQIYTYWQYWLWLGILVAGQALLLLLPINIAERRLPARLRPKCPSLSLRFFSAAFVSRASFPFFARFSRTAA